MNSKANAAEDSIRWARELVLRKKPRYGSALYRALDFGSRAVVAVLDGDEFRAEMYARAAAHCAFRAVKSLRGER